MVVKSRHVINKYKCDLVRSETNTEEVTEEGGFELRLVLDIVQSNFGHDLSLLLLSGHFKRCHCDNTLINMRKDEM